MLQNPIEKPSSESATAASPERNENPYERLRDNCITNLRRSVPELEKAFFECHKLTHDQHEQPVEVYEDTVNGNKLAEFSTTIIGWRASTDPSLREFDQFLNQPENAADKEQLKVSWENHQKRLREVRAQLTYIQYHLPPPSDIEDPGNLSETELQATLDKLENQEMSDPDLLYTRLHRRYLDPDRLVQEAWQEKVRNNWSK